MHFWHANELSISAVTAKRSNTEWNQTRTVYKWDTRAHGITTQQPLDFSLSAEDGFARVLIGYVPNRVFELQPGDLNQDFRVGEGDFAILLENFGKERPNADEGDLTGDGIITFADFMMLAKNVRFPKT